MKNPIIAKVKTKYLLRDRAINTCRILTQINRFPTTKEPNLHGFFVYYAKLINKPNQRSLYNFGHSYSYLLPAMF
jgi:hypothetical protein